jgi:predicted GNAT family N-acyltransferase
MRVKPTESIEFRLASGEAELDGAFRLRHEVYVEELGLRHLATSGDGRLRDEADATGRVLVAVSDGSVVGTLRLNLGADAPIAASYRRELQLDPFLAVVPEAHVMICSRFVLSPEHRGGLVPFHLFARAAEEAASAGVELVFLDCQPHLIRLYYALGFRGYGHVYSDDCWALTVPLVLLAGDIAHLHAVGSPLLQLELPFPESSETTRRAAALLSPEPVVRPAESTQLESRFLAEGQPQLLRGLEPAEIHSVLEHSYVIDLERGIQLISSGQVTRTVYLLLDGELEARDGHRRIRAMHAGDTVGEIAFLLHSRRTLDVVVSSERASVLGLHEPTMRSMLETDARATARLLWNLCEMLASRLATPGGS